MKRIEAEKLVQSSFPANEVSCTKKQSRRKIASAKKKKQKETRARYIVSICVGFFLSLSQESAIQGVAKL